MILYVDTSSLVKLYVEAEGSEQLRGVAGQAYALTTSWVAYTEARAAFARKYREGGLTEDEYRLVVREFERDWGSYLALELSYHILQEAADLAEKHGLRALDAIHLASALYIARAPGGPIALTFASADGRLLEAAKAEGLS